MSVVARPDPRRRGRLPTFRPPRLDPRQAGLTLPPGKGNIAPVLQGCASKANRIGSLPLPDRTDAAAAPAADPRDGNPFLLTPHATAPARAVRPGANPGQGQP